ncbi:MAG: ABC transporter substrate-binding protein [Deltaproteobacteria bacterium]|nr:ABC transporter substrate-binding protein [Deltaproteobacteria bacterium]MBI2228352.1 ABC transporter substrate-binding protein [Deltaproteobacteria bacterium]MBI2365106.1 ABC transporter substrate-binding protein [Deltaproteobacteria bacterium]
MNYQRTSLKQLLYVFLPLFFLVSSAETAERKRITFGYSTLGAMATGAWVAKEIGAFEKHGIQADLIYIASGPVVVQALLGGDLQGGIAGTNAIIAAILGGAPILGVAGTANKPYHRLWVQPEINRVEDLKGKTLGVTRFGSITDNLARMLLRKYAMENAVNIRQFGGTPEVGAAFQQRAIAGTVSADLRVGPNVPAKILLKFVDLGIPYSMNMIPVSRDYYRKNLETVESIVRAYTEGIAALNNEKRLALKVIAKYSRLTDAKSVEDLYQDAVTYLERTPRPDPEAVATILEFLGKKGTPFETFFDNSVVDRMVREGFINKLYSKR